MYDNLSEKILKTNLEIVIISVKDFYFSPVSTNCFISFMLIFFKPSFSIVLPVLKKSKSKSFLKMEFAIQDEKNILEHPGLDQ